MSDIGQELSRAASMPNAVGTQSPIGCASSSQAISPASANAEALSDLFRKAFPSPPQPILFPRYIPKDREMSMLPSPHAPCDPRPFGDPQPSCGCRCLTQRDAPELLQSSNCRAQQRLFQSQESDGRTKANLTNLTLQEEAGYQVCSPAHALRV